HRDVLVIKPEHAWCLMQRGDKVLLSDQRSHHWTSVYEVDRQRAHVFFLDRWPQLLLDGFNDAGVSAELRPLPERPQKTLVKITRAEFMRVAAAVVTLDTPDLVDYYVRINAQAAQDPWTYLAFGLAALNTEETQFAEPSVRL